MRISRNDLRVAVRVFARHPAFAIAAVLSLAIAIALNTTMYSFLDAMVQPKLDITDVDRFYNIVVFRDIRIRAEPGQLTAVLRSGGRTYDALTTATTSTDSRPSSSTHASNGPVSCTSPRTCSTPSVSASSADVVFFRPTRRPRRRRSSSAIAWPSA